MTTEIDQIKLDHAILGKRIATLEAKSQQQIIHLPARQVILRPGEKYAGILRGLDGEPDIDLFLLSDEKSSLAWQEGMDWAASFGDDNIQVPDRREGHLLQAQLPELFRPELYWLREQYAGSSDYAWGQNFGVGYQGWDRKNDRLRCRLVRRSIISYSSIFQAAA